MEKITYNISEAAAALGVSRPLMYRLIKSADFPSLKVGSRVLIPVSSLEEWAHRHAEHQDEVAL